MTFDPALASRRVSMNEIVIGEEAEEDYARSLEWYAERSKHAAEGI